MDRSRLCKLLKDVRENHVSVKSALQSLKTFPFDDLGFAKIDTHRDLRKGFPEVIFCQGKQLDHIKAIVKKIQTDKVIMATRANLAIYRAIKKIRKDAVFHKEARIVLAGKTKIQTKKYIVVTSAGTADIPVAEEAAVTAEALGNPVQRLFDVGVAGIHRLFSKKEVLMDANVIIVVAGMEGALASIVGGVVKRPVIAVPTSVGYGAHFKGIAPLLTMLNSCAPGVAVVNIDNGFGAGYMASLINKG